MMWAYDFDLLNVKTDWVVASHLVLTQLKALQQMENILPNNDR